MSDCDGWVDTHHIGVGFICKACRCIRTEGQVSAPYKAFAIADLIMFRWSGHYYIRWPFNYKFIY